VQIFTQIEMTIDDTRCTTEADLREGAGNPLKGLLLSSGVAGPLAARGGGQICRPSEAYSEGCGGAGRKLESLFKV